MRTFLSSLIPLALLFTVDVDVTTMSVGVNEAQAQFTGRIKRIRIRKRRVGSYYQVVVDSPTGPNATAATLFAALEPTDGAPPVELVGDTAAIVRDTVRFEFALSAETDLSLVTLVVNTADGVTEAALEELLAGGDLGADVPINGADASARVVQIVNGSDDTTVEVEIRSVRGASLETLEQVVLTAPSRDADGAPLTVDPASANTTRIFEMEIVGNGDEPLVGAFTAEAVLRDASGAVVDESRFALAEGVEPDVATIERVALRANSRGTVLVTRVRSPDASPVLLEASVTDMDGGTVLALADEAPQWTERQFTAGDLTFGDDPTGSTYLALLTAFDAEGNPVGEQFEVNLTAEQPTEAGEIETSLFNEDRAQVALIPGEEDGSWQVFMRTVDDVPASRFELIFEEPYEGPAPDETELDAELSGVWRQFRQRDTTPAEGQELRQVSVKVNPESDSPAEASGLEAAGAVLATGNSVEDIDGFLASLSGPRRSIRIRAKKTRRVRR